VEAQARAGSRRPRVLRSRSLRQLAGAAPYSQPALGALLRLYLIFPEACKPALVSACLQLAVQRLPDGDAHLLSHLVPERLAADGEVGQVSALAAHLDCCRFKEYWAAAAALAAAASPVPARLEAAARAHAAHCLAQAYRSMGAATAGEALGLGAAELAGWVAGREGWSMEGDVVTLPQTEGNHPLAVEAASLPMKQLLARLV